MRFRSKRSYFLGVLLLFISIIGFSYIFRLREALVSSTSSYKNTIIGLNNKTSLLEEEVSRLEEENTRLKNTIVSQGVHVTNGASAHYNFEVSPTTVSINNKKISIHQNKEHIRFIVAGHIYGSPNNRNAVIPSQSLIKAIPTINIIQPQLFFTLGDLTYSASEISYQELYNKFLSEVNAPILNAPGNHDFTNGREFYEKKYGQSFYYFPYANNQIIVLDTEIASCHIVGRQKEMLEKALNTALDNTEIDNIFIFLHKVLFLDGDLLLRNQTNGICEFGTNFTEIYDSLLLPSSYKKNIYLIAGDVGAFGGNLSPFFNKNSDTNLYTIAIGLGDSQEDALLQVDIEDTKVSFKLIPIGNKQLMPLESYSRQYWSKHP